MATTFSITGVCVSFIARFIDEHGGRKAFEGLTTTNVCETIIKPATFALQTSYCEMLERRGEGGLTGPAQWFVSHAWQYQFLDVVDSLADFMVREYGARSDDIIVWFDLFANSQHNTDAKPFKWWTGTFMNAIKSMGNVVMVCMPFGDPVTLTRAWCIFELYACVESGSRFEVAMTAAENDRFLAAMSNEPGVYYKMLASVNTCQAKAFKPSDLDNILDVVRKTVGFTKMDSI